MFLLEPNILADVVRTLIPSDANCERLRWSGGTPNATGEFQGATPSLLAFRALVTGSQTVQARRMWGELADGEMLALLDTSQLSGATIDEQIAQLVVGDEIRHKGRIYEVKERRLPELDGKVPFMRLRLREVQNNGSK